MEKLMDLLRRPMMAIEGEKFQTLVLLLAKGALCEYRSNPSLLASMGSLLGSSAGKTLIIPIEGVLTNSDSWWGTTYTAIQNGLTRAASDDIDRVILSVDSGGGEVTGVMETAAMIAELAKVKPVTAMVNGMAASAAYWLASQARDIVLTPSGEVGSVGVRVTHVDVSKMLQDAGINVTEMFAGDYKTEFTPFAPLSKESKDYMQTLLDDTYNKFLAAVSGGRGTRVTANARKDKYGNGRMFTADAALTDGMVDKISAPMDFYKSLAPVAPPAVVRVEDSSLDRARLEVLKAKVL